MEATDGTTEPRTVGVNHTERSHGLGAFVSP